MITMGEFWIIKNKSQLDDRIKFFREWLLSEWDWNYAVQFKPKRYVNSRSLSQNALFHVWCKEMSDYFSAKGADVTPEKMKELLKYKLLGTEDRVINTTVIPNQIRRTRDLDRGEMMDFMDLVQNWALDNGVNVSCPAESEYMKLREVQYGSSTN